MVNHLGLVAKTSIFHGWKGAHGIYNPQLLTSCDYYDLHHQVGNSFYLRELITTVIS